MAMDGKRSKCLSRIFLELPSLVKMSLGKDHRQMVIIVVANNLVTKKEKKIHIHI